MAKLEDEMYAAHEALKKRYAEDLAKLPKVNLGALFMPGVWGPAHGQWLTVLFYPIWLLADTCICNGVKYGGLAIVLATLVVLGTAALMVFYARTVGVNAYLRVADRVDIKKYLHREHIWIAVSAVIAAVFLGIATWYNLAIRIPQGLF
jgi:hypothetical protein